MKVNIAATPKRKFVVKIGKKTEEPALALPWSEWPPEFRNVVQQAVDASLQASKRNALATQKKLSAEAYLRETLKLSPTGDRKMVTALHRKLETKPTAFKLAPFVLHKMCTELRGINMPTPPTAATWPRTERWLLGRDRVPAVLAELNGVGHSSIDLLGVAILKTADQFPSAFGNADYTQQEVKTDTAEAEKRRDELCSKILEAARIHNCIDFGKYDGHGRTSHAVFRGTGIPIVPDPTAGTRLVQSLISAARLVEAIKQSQRVK